MIATAVRAAQHEHPLAWPWPIDLSAYDQRPRLMRREVAALARRGKSLVLFNLHRAIATKTRTVVAVEGFFDTIAVHQAGSPVVGLMGSTLSRHQADLFANHSDRVVLMLDGDEAGRQGAMSIAQTRATRMSVVPIVLDNGRQPDQMTPRQIVDVLSTALVRTV